MYSTSGCHIWIFFCIYLVYLVNNVRCWDSDDLELFDLVEEVNGDFYELLGVTRASI